jgi:hypothetical protein
LILIAHATKRDQEQAVDIPGVQAGKTEDSKGKEFLITSGIGRFPGEPPQHMVHGMFWSSVAAFDLTATASDDAHREKPWAPNARWRSLRPRLA